MPTTRKRQREQAAVSQSVDSPPVVDSDMMLLTVKTLIGTLSIEVDKLDKVEAVQYAIQRSRHYPPQQQILVFAGKRLESRRLLSDTTSEAAARCT